MVLLALPSADHLLIERDRGQFVPSRRRRMMANARAERLLKIPAEPSPELRIPNAAAQTREVSLAGIRLGSWESAHAFKGISCDDVSEVGSYMPSQAVGLHEAFKGSTEVTLTTPANTGPTTAFRPWPSRGKANMCTRMTILSEGDPHRIASSSVSALERVASA